MAFPSDIGDFIIGESPIEGAPYDPQPTVISQYGNSQILLSLIDSIAQSLDPFQNIGDFYDLVFNIVTAQGWGLDVWGRIVNVSRVLTLPATDFLGFEEGPSGEPFGQAPFNSPNNNSSDNFYLTDNAYRLLILTKALANISRAAIPVYNQMLMELFPGRGNAFVQDTGGMSMRMTFQFALSPLEVAILKESGAIQAPTGVLLNILIVDIPHQFGFAEAGYSAQSFNNGTFFGGFQ